jgi:hypothetical protein
LPFFEDFEVVDQADDTTSPVGLVNEGWEAGRALSGWPAIQPLGAEFPVFGPRSLSPGEPVGYYDDSFTGFAGQPRFRNPGQFNQFGRFGQLGRFGQPGQFNQFGQFGDPSQITRYLPYILPYILPYLNNLLRNGGMNQFGNGGMNQFGYGGMNQFGYGGCGCPGCGCGGGGYGGNGGGFYGNGGGFYNNGMFGNRPLLNSLAGMGLSRLFRIPFGYGRGGRLFSY